MSIENPAVILYDSSGNAVSVVLENGVYRLRVQTTGAAASGSAVSGNPVLIAGSDGTNARSVRTASDGTIRIDPTGTTTQPVSIASLPLPSGAATEATLATLLTSSTFTSRINTLGQKTMVNSMPVVLASDQSTLPISVSSLPLPTGAATESTLATRLSDSTFTGRINTFGQKAMASSTPVVIASDQSTLPVSGTVSTTQGTNPWVISASSLPLPTGAATETTLSTRLSESTFTTRTNTLGQKLMSGSMPVVLASDQSTLPVSGTVTANVGTTNGLALDATLTSGAQKSIVRGGAKGTTTAADITSISVDTNTQALHVQLAAQGTSGAPLRVDPTGTTTQPISATSLPLPAGAATETTLGTRLADSTFTTRINTLGQKTMTGSTPVVIASDQSTITVDGYVTADIGNTNGLALDATVNSILKESTFTSRTNSLGQKTASGSMPVVIASNQSAIPVTILEGSAGGVQKSLYDIGATDIYIGTAAQGTASSDAAWLITKITLDGSGNPVSKLYSTDTAIWDNRILESYS